MAGVAITRTELGAARLRQAAAQSRDADAARRMLALALVLDGHGRGEAAALCGLQPASRAVPPGDRFAMDRQTLRDWVHRYNEHGLPGLSDRVPPGSKPRLSSEQEAEVAALVRRGPTLSEHGVVRWRRLDLSKAIQARFGVRLAERSVGDLLRRMGFRRLSTRPRHPGQKPAEQEAHKETLPTWSWPRSPSARSASRSSFGGRTRRGLVSRAPWTRLWAERGSRPPAPRDRRYAWAYLFGAVCPARGVGAGLVLPYANAHAMALHLAEISRHVRPGAHRAAIPRREHPRSGCKAVVTVDRAGWHKQGGKLRVPSNVSLLYLPSYSPELNPQENVWQYLRQNQLSNRVFETYNAIVDACCDAWNSLMGQPERITSIAARD